MVLQLLRTFQPLPTQMVRTLGMALQVIVVAPGLISQQISLPMQVRRLPSGSATGQMLLLPIRVCLLTISPSPVRRWMAVRPIQAGPMTASFAQVVLCPCPSSTPTSQNSVPIKAMMMVCAPARTTSGSWITRLRNWVEHFPYQDGLLVWYYDELFADNNVGDNCAGGRCGGLYLPVDAHPDLLLRPDNGQVWRPRMQSYDSTFGLDTTDVICLHINTTIEQCYGGLPGNPKFDDSQSYWFAPDASIGNNGWASVPVPNTGTTITVKSISAQGNFMQVHVNKK